MNIWKLSVLSLRHRVFHTMLCISMAAFSVMAGVLVILTTDHVRGRIIRDTAGIDLVVGARGSPLQLILSSLYHVDIPTGNMSASEADEILHNPEIALAIPLALGDNVDGFRIAGTDSKYIDLYNATYAKGTVWTKPYEAVAGAYAARELGMQIGSAFSGSHGLGTGGRHHQEKYVVTGILNPTGTIIDRLILTSVASVQDIHSQHHHDEDEHNEHNEHKSPAEITALLVKVKNPRAVINLPRWINRETHVMAASPAMELTRLTVMLGLSSRLVMGIAVILMVMAALSIFSGLASSLENRGDDFAVMRLLGMSRLRLFQMIVMEAGLTAAMGALAGMVTGHFLFAGLIFLLEPLQASGATALAFYYEELVLMLVVVLAGLLAALIPALRAYRTDVARLLSARGGA